MHTPRVAYHMGELDRANLEPLVSDSHTRGTGKLGTGLYVVLSLDALNLTRDDADVLCVIHSPWQQPFVLERSTKKSEADDWQFTTFYSMCEGLVALATSPGEPELAAVKKIIEKGKKLWTLRLLPYHNVTEVVDIAHRRVSQARMSLRARLGPTVNPMTAVLKDLGFDGIVNEVLDNTTHGSVIFDHDQKYLDMDRWKRAKRSMTVAVGPSPATPGPGPAPGKKRARLANGGGPVNVGGAKVRAKRGDGHVHIKVQHAGK